MDEDEFGQLTETADVHTIRIPDSDRVVEAAFLSDETPDWNGHNPREMYADWLTGDDNPYFARAECRRSPA
jgi:hypothetical protein